MVKDNGCIFCRIAAGTVPSTKLFEDGEFLCVRDIQPQAKVHLLVIPKENISSLDEAFPVHGHPRHELMGRLLETATKVARQQGLLPEGFRLAINTGRAAGQTVFHLHVHILGGEALGATFA